MKFDKQTEAWLSEMGVDKDAFIERLITILKESQGSAALRQAFGVPSEIKGKKGIQLFLTRVRRGQASEKIRRLTYAAQIISSS